MNKHKRGSWRTCICPEWTGRSILSWLQSVLSCWPKPPKEKINMVFFLSKLLDYVCQGIIFIHNWYDHREGSFSCRRLALAPPCTSASAWRTCAVTLWTQYWPFKLWPLAVTFEMLLDRLPERPGVFLPCGEMERQKPSSTGWEQNIRCFKKLFPAVGSGQFCADRGCGAGMCPCCWPELKPDNPITRLSY